MVGIKFIFELLFTSLKKYFLRDFNFEIQNLLASVLAVMVAAGLKLLTMLPT